MNTVKNQITNMFDDYNIWKTNKSFYNGRVESTIDWFFDLPCFHYSDVASINQCLSNVIVIDNITESVHSKSTFARYDNTKHYVIVSGGTWNKQKHNIGIDSYDILYYPFFIFELVDNYFSPRRFCFYLDKNYDFVYPKPYIFVSTTGVVRSTRTIFNKKICDNTTYDNFLLRYSGEDLGQPSNQYDIVNFKKGKFDPYIDIIEKYYHNVSQTLPINMYNQCYFNLCVETDIDLKDCFFITEKTIKCLISGMPFVSVNHPDFLSELNNYGFRTYGELWDESYDNEIDFNKRLDKIAKLVNDLGTIDWNSIKKELLDIANHNLRNLTNLDKYANEFFNSLNAVADRLK